MYKKSLLRFADNWKDRLGLESARAALCKRATCTRQTFLSKTFAKSFNIQKQYEKNVCEKSNAAYSLSIRVQTHILIFLFLCFLRQYQRQRKCFLSVREPEKALRDIWLGPSNFCLVRFAWVQPLYGAERKESWGTGLGNAPKFKYCSENIWKNCLTCLFSLFFTSNRWEIA